MPSKTKLTKNGHTIETSVPSEVVQLRAQGYKDVPQFDNGGELNGGLVAVTNNTGKPEPVSPKPSK